MQGGVGSSVCQKGGCAPPIAQAGCVGPDSRICVRRLHLLAGHHVKVPDRCLRCTVGSCLLSVFAHHICILLIIYYLFNNLIISSHCFFVPHKKIVVEDFWPHDRDMSYTVFGCKQEHAPCKIHLLQQRLFLCQLNFMEIMRLSQYCGESGHLLLLRILSNLIQCCLCKWHFFAYTLADATSISSRMFAVMMH